MSTTIKTFALGILSLLAVYGCGQSAPDKSTNPPNTEDQLIGFKGNVDHAGLVEGATIMLTTASFAPLDPALDAFNHEDPFNVVGKSFKDAFAQNLAKFDAIDGKTDWSPEQTATWIARVGSGNYQVVDTSKPCNFADPHTYLEIERAQLTGTEHKTCGGRTPNEDAFDVTVNFLARGPTASAQDEGALSDGVDQATQKSVGTFPYLAELN
jgi:hypothetical protein